MKKKHSKQKEVIYSRGHWYTMGFFIGLAAGVIMGIAIRNLSLGLIFGVAIGTSLGFTLAEYHNPKKKFTSEELKKRKIGLAISLGIGLIVLILGLTTFYLTNLTK